MAQPSRGRRLRRLGSGARRARHSSAGSQFSPSPSRHALPPAGVRRCAGHSGRVTERLRRSRPRAFRRGDEGPTSTPPIGDLDLSEVGHSLGRSLSVAGSPVNRGCAGWGCSSLAGWTRRTDSGSRRSARSKARTNGLDAGEGCRRIRQRRAAVRLLASPPNSCGGVRCHGAWASSLISVPGACSGDMMDDRVPRGAGAAARSMGAVHDERVAAGASGSRPHHIS